MIIGFAAAENKIEAAAMRLGLLDEGNPMEPAQARNTVTKHYPDRAEELWRTVQSRAITIDAYIQGWLQLFLDFDRMMYVHRLEAQLEELAKEQT